MHVLCTLYTHCMQALVTDVIVILGGAIQLLDGVTSHRPFTSNFCSVATRGQQLARGL